MVTSQNAIITWLILYQVLLPLDRPDRLSVCVLCCVVGGWGVMGVTKPCSVFALHCSSLHGCIQYHVILDSPVFYQFFFLLLSRSGWACGRLPNLRNHISVTAWWIFTVQSSVELSRPVVVHCHCHLPICPIWACPWAKNLSNLAQIGSRLCGTHISETTGWIYPIWSFMDLSGPVVVQRHSYLPICPIWACLWAKNLSNQAALRPHFAEPIYLWNPWMDLYHSKFYGIV